MIEFRSHRSLASWLAAIRRNLLPQNYVPA